MEVYVGDLGKKTILHFFSSEEKLLFFLQFKSGHSHVAFFVQ